MNRTTQAILSATLAVSLTMATAPLSAQPAAPATATVQEQSLDFEAFRDVPTTSLDPDAMPNDGQYAQLLIVAYRLGFLSRSVAYACASRPDGCAMTASAIKKMYDKVKKYCKSHKVAACGG